MCGGTFSQIDGDGYAGFNQPGLTGGVFIQLPVNKKLDIKMEFIYTAKGAREANNTTESILYTWKLRYIEVPLKLTYLIEKYKIPLVAGITQGYLMSNYKETNQVEDQDLEPSKYEIGWVVGGGYQFNDHFSVMWEYNYSLFAIRKFDNSTLNYGIIARTLNITNGNYNNLMRLVLYYTFSHE
jgi:opacity protein-like surface antigen